MKELQLTFQIEVCHTWNFRLLNKHAMITFVYIKKKKKTRQQYLICLVTRTHGRDINEGLGMIRFKFEIVQNPVGKERLISRRMVLRRPHLYRGCVLLCGRYTSVHFLSFLSLLHFKIFPIKYFKLKSI